MYEHAMLDLRRKVREVEENDLLDQTLLRGSRAGLVQPPSTNNVDQLLRSMMGTNVQATSTFARPTSGGERSETVAPGPWLKKEVITPPFGPTDEDSEADAESVFAALGNR